MSERRFTSHASAVKYVWNVMVSMLQNEFNEPDLHEGWMFGGVELDEDRDMVVKALRDVIKAVEKKAKR